VPDNDGIPLAKYGSSNIGRMKTVYRRGLGLRYGRHMQTIAGVHFNYSLPASFWSHYQQIVGDGGTEDQFRSELCLGLVRNFHRFGWLILYLFGASPAMCKSFGGDDGFEMQSLNAETWYEPFGTSLRMSDLGYSNQNQSRINISLNSLQEYTRDLGNATTTPEPAYEKFGVKVDGEYQQLNANQLQIENEYYSPVRPKRVTRSGEQPTAALQRSGVEYVEIRSLDINIIDPAGINQNTMRFIEAFLIYCLIEDSPPLDKKSTIETRRNQAEMAKRGRDPSFRLHRDGAELTLANWAHEILDKVSGIAGLIDQSEGGESYRQAIQLMRDLIDEPGLTPSARLLDELRDADCSFFEFVMSLAKSHKNYFAAIAPLSSDQQQKFENEVLRSIERQREIEQSDAISFDEYLETYFRSI
jgi:glutamate--cysteine ligase